jgi:hypothetical protein
MTRSHETGPRHTDGQLRRLANRQRRITSDHLGRGTREAAQWGPARHPSKVVQAGPAQRRVTAAQGNAELPERPRDEGICDYRFTEGDGRKGPPAGNKAGCNRTNTPHSMSMQRKAKSNQTPQTHTRSARQAETTSSEGRARPRIGVRLAARVAMHAPDRHRDA